MALPLIPLLWIAGGSVGVAALHGTAKVAEETGEAVEKSEGFLTRVIVLTVIGGVIYFGAKAVK
ncbi:MULTISPECIES: hypothetical protein [Aliivibrio]|uniref:Uncharacterized protein n=1 Tax=Aliivibrio finisterrensis TaxID=511998 RepID=A0A4Q5KY84_9GAMM|nr:MULTISPECIES: hypothetical protein [Aliivibrio]MDD9178430.1 hypothetical protein [Aliivibrio sp. A6]RYU53325.1 hypothetical protein ERW57_04140 [Aliivibrio finisterrensis]RYU65832.1 hypothetical protein ERW53_04660 [Aliivibrio finisterrensis]RYU86623.1 hypothetical protein ERW52_06000 [Aliivibrio finisterrensis]